MIFRTVPVLVRICLIDMPAGPAAAHVIPQGDRRLSGRFKARVLVGREETYVERTRLSEIKGTVG